MENFLAADLGYLAFLISGILGIACIAALMAYGDFQ